MNFLSLELLKFHSSNVGLVYGGGMTRQAGELLLSSASPLPTHGPLSTPVLCSLSLSNYRQPTALEKLVLRHKK